MSDPGVEPTDGNESDLDHEDEVIDAPVPLSDEEMLELDPGSEEPT